MIDFIILAYPRSRTAWLANWLTTGNTVCLHDGLLHNTMEGIQNKYKKYKIGVTDTGTAAFPDVVNSVSTKRLIIHRDIDEVTQSFGIELPFVDLFAVQGKHIHYREINDKAEEIWEYLIGEGFSEDRFQLLKDFNVQVNFNGLPPLNQDAIRTYTHNLLLLGDPECQDTH